VAGRDRSTFFSLGLHDPLLVSPKADPPLFPRSQISSCFPFFLSLSHDAGGDPFFAAASRPADKSFSSSSLFPVATRLGKRLPLSVFSLFPNPLIGHHGRFFPSLSPSGRVPHDQTDSTFFFFVKAEHTYPSFFFPTPIFFFFRCESREDLPLFFFRHTRIGPG